MKNILLSATALLILTGCQAVPAEPTDTISVAASFYPLAFLAENVGGEHARVLQVTPSGVEPHDFEPSPTQLAEVHNAGVFLMNGAGVDKWAEKVAEELSQKGVVTVEMARHLDMLKGFADEHGDGVEEHEKDHDDHEGGMDPHVWLDPRNMQQQAGLIRDAFIAADPDHAEAYRSNAEELIAKLAKLDEEFHNGLETCDMRFVVVSHNAFGYLAARYDFETLAIAGFAPGQEPSPKRLAELSDIAEARGVRHIFFETLASPKLSETIANEVGAQALVLNPIEGISPEDKAHGSDYFSLMRQNLHNLRTAMQCQ